MKKTKINLLINREDYQKFERYFLWLRISVGVLGAIVFVILIYFFITLFSQNQKMNDLTQQKQTLLLVLKDKEDVEAKVLYVDKKYQDVKTYLTEDARSLPYYNLLTSALTAATGAASLKSFQINKNREVDFTVSFSNFSDLMSFFKFIESEQFLKNFEKVSLKSFNAIGQTEKQKESYDLAFTGKFVQLNENQN